MQPDRRTFLGNLSALSLGFSGLGVLPNNWTRKVGQVRKDEGEDPVLFFDAFTQIGPRRVNHSKEQTQLSHLLAEMDHCSISAALVTSTMSLSYDAYYSNLRLSEELASYAHLFPIWNVMPHITGEFPEPKALLKQMQENNVRAVTIHPKSNAWDWQGSHCLELFSQLIESGVLTIVPNVEEMGSWHDLDVFLAKYPRLPVLLKNISWAAQRYLIPLIVRHQNLHICFDTFQINEGLEYFYELGLIDQLVFASNAPTMSVGAQRTYIDYAQIPRIEREKIAGSNLLKLLKLPESTLKRENQSEDLLMQYARQALSLPVNVIDMHMHILHEGLQGAGRHYRMRNGGPSGVFSLAEKLGYSGGGIMSWDGVVSQDAKSGNETTRLALEAAPQGYWGLGTFDPTQFSQTEMEQMIHAVYQDSRFIGMKPYPMYGVEYDDPSYAVWWEYGNQHHFYGLLHNSRSDLKETDVLAAKYPNIRWIIAHAANSFSMAERAIEIMQKHTNVFAEITYTSVPLGAIEYLVEEAGEDRILYGSDLPMRDPRPQLGWVIYSRLPVAVKEKILAFNALNVITPCLSRLPQENQPVLKHKK